MRGVAKWLHSFISFIPRTDWLFVLTYSRLLCHAPCHVCCEQTKRNASYASRLVTSTGYPRVVERFSLSILTSGRTRTLASAAQHSHRGTLACAVYCPATFFTKEKVAALQLELIAYTVR
jgi:hypothetical protein